MNKYEAAKAALKLLEKPQDELLKEITGETSLPLFVADERKLLQYILDLRAERDLKEAS